MCSKGLKRFEIGSKTHKAVWAVLLMHTQPAGCFCSQLEDGFSSAAAHTRLPCVCGGVRHSTRDPHTHSVEPYLPENRAHIWVRARDCACVFLSTTCCAAEWCWLRVTGVLVMDGPDDGTSDTARKEASVTGELWFKGGGGGLSPPKVEFLLKTQTKWGLREVCAQNVNIMVD